MSDEGMKPTFNYTKHIVRDLTTDESFVFESSSEACKSYNTLLSDNPEHELLYEIIYPDYKQSKICKEKKRNN